MASIVSIHTRSELSSDSEFVYDSASVASVDGVNQVLRYVHDHRNEQNGDIQFTKEIEENEKLPFLDCLVTLDNNELQTIVYSKPKHTDRLRDESSYKNLL